MENKDILTYNVKSHHNTIAIISSNRSIDFYNDNVFIKLYDTNGKSYCQGNIAQKIDVNHKNNIVVKFPLVGRPKEVILEVISINEGLDKSLVEAVLEPQALQY